MTMCMVEITLEEPVIASFDVATAASPTSLSYLPGAMLWGVLVAKVYDNKLPADEVMAMFYGKGIVIDDALPICGETFALPMPKSLHQPKDGGKWEDWSKDTHKSGYKQAKSGHIGPQESAIKVQMISSQRTAIDPENLRAADGQFYGLEAIKAGHRLMARIEGPEDQVQQAIEILEGTHYLGRSRNAEYGRVTIRKVGAPTLPGLGTDKAIYLWCLSDLAAYDEYYLPSERPSDSFFGAKINWSRSFVRHRTYSPYNAKWKTRQPERLVISRGSVLVLEDGIDSGLHRYGFHQEQGLGLIMASAQPPLSLLRNWQQAETQQTETKEEVSSTTTTTLLSKWLSSRVREAKKQVEQTREVSEAWKEIWRPRYMAAEHLAGERCGPTPSQWGALVGMNDEGLCSFLQKVKGESKERESRIWQARFESGDKGTFADAVMDLLPDTDVLRHTAHTVRAELIKEGWFNAQ